jgi:hypothetical protein
VLHVAPVIPVVELEHLALAVDEVLAVLLWVQLFASVGRNTERLAQQHSL